MGNKNIFNNGVIVEMCKINNLVWQKYRIYKENYYRFVGKGLQFIVFVQEV